MSGTAEWISDAPAVLAALTDRLPVGTWLVFTHITDEFYPHHIQAAAETLGRAGIPYHPRGRDEIMAMLAGYKLLAPGLIAPHRWAPTPRCDSGDGDGEGEGEGDNGDGIRKLSPAAPRHRGAWDLSAYAAIGQLHPGGAW